MNLTLIRGGDLIDPVGETVEKVDLLIEKGKISKIFPRGGV